MKLLIPLFVGASLLFCGCATTIAPTATVTGSAASGDLLSETTRMVLAYDSIRMPDCKARRRITAEPLVSDKPGVIAERWRVERCGQTKYYRVTFTNGTKYSFQEE